ncbi:MAG: hypothetical protein ACK4RV_02330 [Caulobacter sp.]
MAKTFAELLRLFPKASDLGSALAEHGCAATPVLVRRWWGGEMLPARAWLAFVKACQARGHTDVTLELLATIAETPRADRVRTLEVQRVKAMADDMRASA